MKARSLEFQIALVLQLVVGATIALFSASAILLTSRALERQESAFLTNASSLMVDGLEHELREESDLHRAAAAALEEISPPGVWIEILDDRGQLVRATPGATTPRRASEVHEARVRLQRGPWVVTSIATRPRHDAVAALGAALLVTGLPLFGIVTLLSRSIARRALLPLSRMAKQAEQASDFARVGPLGRSNDPAEVAALAASFNRLLARLEQMLHAEQAFSRDAAHELRTPLTVMSGELEYARADPELGERQRVPLARAWDQVQTMTELVEALLLLRHADPQADSSHPAFVPVNLADIARDLSREMAERPPRRTNDLVIDTADEVLVRGHPILLSSAVRNLLSNAFKFTHGGQPVRVSVFKSGGRARVVVEDAGKGVPDEDRERIFDAFYRDPEARATQDGFGLGLPILRRVARAHGGDVVVEHSMLGGARFELWIPSWRPRS